MGNDCPICKNESHQDEIDYPDCSQSSCGHQVPASESTVKTQQPDFTTSPSVENKKYHKKTKIVTIIGVFAITALIIGISYWALFINTNSDTEITKYYLRNSGPKINLQSSLTGSLNPIPDQGYYASYGYYYQNTKVGTSLIENAVRETFQGKQCNKIKTTGNMDMTAVNSQTKFTFESFEYHMIEDNMVFFVSMNYQYSIPSLITASADYQWNRDNNTMIVTTEAAGKTTSVICSLPDKYWELASSIRDNPQAGYTDELTYTMDMEGLEPITVNVVLVVSEPEDINVPNGDYTDCYVVSLSQTYKVLGSDYSQTFTIWMDSKGVMPQAEITSSSASATSTSVMKLEEYYTTVPPGDSEPI